MKYHYHWNDYLHYCATLDAFMSNDPDPIFVFGSNLLGIHGGGAAKFAMDHCGAVWGIGQGFQREQNSVYHGCYALPTKYSPAQSLEIELVDCAVQLFKAFARECKDRTFFVSAVGTNLAGFTHDDIAPLFMNSPTNCIFPEEWEEYLDA